MSITNWFSRTDSRRALFVVLSLALFAAFAFQLIYHAVRTSATVDEPDHILAGHRHWQCGDFGINPEHPPLLKLLAAAPLNFRKLSEPPWECGSKLTSTFDTFSYGSTFLVENGVDSVLVSTRLAASLMGMLLALLVFLAAWEMFGRWEALTALAIVAFEPNLIGHGSIVTTDMAISATAFGAVYALYRFGKDQTLIRFLVAGLALGLMLTTKHSAVIFVGILFVLLIADAAIYGRSGSGLSRRVFRRIVAFSGIFLIGLAMLWSFYGFRYRAIPNTTEPEVSVANYIKENGRPESIGSFPALVTEAISHTRIFPESYMLGMADVIAFGTRNSWIFGRAYPTGRWFYFPVAFIVKSSIPLLFLLPIGLIFLYVTPEKRREGMFLLVPAIVFFLFASSSNFNTGVRHILPIYALLIVVASAGAIWLCRKFSAFRYALIALLLFNAAATVRTAPAYLAYANDLWGGYENTHRIFVDSNTDTGQSMKLVSEYLAREGVQDCWIATFVHPEMIGSVQPCRNMPSGVVRVMTSRNLIEPVPPVIEGTVVLSVMEIPPRGGDEYMPITQSEPVAFIGGNTYIYRGRFEVPLAAAISRVHRSGYFLRMNQVDDAIAEGREAVKLGPDDPRTHLALGLAISRTEQKDEARRELESAVELAKPDPRFRIAEVRAQRELEQIALRK
ncbi:MAG TPA: glycosyltransferase family 39 protein [Pyrinomonadaceae bacterium]|nr:glycosyltransferase family 39 protein [Pyrinomonadaceae bacterium]